MSRSTFSILPYINRQKVKAAGKVLGKADAAEQNKLMYEQFLAKTGGCNDTDSK